MNPFILRSLKFLICLGLLLGGLSLAACAVSWNGFTLLEWWRESHSGLVLFRAHTPGKVVALTFDDGPDPHYTPRILAILKTYGVHATFFEEGRQVEAYPRLARAVLAAGHVIGNHTYSHPYLNHKSRRVVRREMERCEVCLEDALHCRSHLFRPPRGRWNPTIFREARREHNRIILWTVAVEHQDARTPRAMADRALRLIRPGGILLLHDGAHPSRESTVQALPLLLKGLKARGYRCVTIPELLHIPGDEKIPTAMPGAITMGPEAYPNPALADTPLPQDAHASQSAKLAAAAIPSSRPVPRSSRNLASPPSLR